MKNIQITRKAIKQVLQEIEVPSFNYLKKSTNIPKSMQVRDRVKKRDFYLKYAKQAKCPVCEKYFYLRIKKGIKPFFAIENKKTKWKLNKF